MNHQISWLTDDNMKKIIATFAICLLAFSCGDADDQTNKPDSGTPDSGKISDSGPKKPVSHAWGNYHWGIGGPTEVTLSQNLSPIWQSYLTSASIDWSRSRVINTSIIPGTVDVQTCPPAAGTVEVCNAKYGENGWLGMANVWFDDVGQITQATVTFNDTYFDKPDYSGADWRMYVACHEVGHVLGLNHRDETFSNPNLGSCLDYTNDPGAFPANTHPDAFDYEVLETIYDGVTSKDTVPTRVPGARIEDRFITRIFPVMR